MDKMAEAMQIGNLFATPRLSELTSNIEIALAVFAAELGRQQHDAPPPRVSRNVEEERRTMEWAGWGQWDVELMYAVLLLCGGAGQLSRQLANPRTSSLGFVQLGFMNLLLGHVTKINDHGNPRNPTRFTARPERAFQREVFRIMDSEKFKSCWDKDSTYEHRCDKRKRRHIMQVLEAEAVVTIANVLGPFLSPASWEPTSMQKQRRLGRGYSAVPSQVFTICAVEYTK